MHNRHKIFSFDFSIRERIYLGILKAELQIPDFKGTRDITLQSGFFAFFHRFYSSAQPAPVSGNTDLWYHISRLNQNPEHMSCRVNMYTICICSSVTEKYKELSLTRNWYNQNQSPVLETKLGKTKITNRHIKKRTNG